MNNNKIWLETARDLLDIQNKIKYLREKQKMQVTILKDLSGDSGRSLEGYEFKPIFRKGPVQYNKIEYLKTINLDEFRSQDVKVWNLKFTKQFDI